MTARVGDAGQRRARERLLAAATAYVTECDQGDLSLRQIAAAIGTSHRMLVYHFGSKEGLFVEIVRRVEEDQRQRFARMLADESAPLMERMHLLWTGLTDPKMWPRERLFFEVYGQALQGRPYTRAFLAEVVEAWLEPLTAMAARAGIPESETRAAAQLMLAVTRGLLLTLLTTGDRENVDRAMDCFVQNFAPFGAAKAENETGRAARPAPRRHLRAKK